MNKNSLESYFIRTIASIFPRNKRIWVTGKITGWESNNLPPMFFDNSKYFYLYLVNKTDEKVFWITNSTNEYNLLKEMNLPVLKYESFIGKWIVARAKYSFHHYGPNQINWILQLGSTQIDFWHGTPLKKIRYDVVPKQEIKLNPLAKLLNIGNCEYISSTSDYLSKNILKSAFAAEDWQMINFGYPRMDILKYDKNQLIDFCKRYSKELVNYIKLTDTKNVFLYMPTWRDNDPDYFKKAKIDFFRLNEELEKRNAVFFLKLHPLTKDVDLDDYRNIIKISNDIDIYPFLKFVDYLVTDYSSIFFDFLPLNREIIFIPYDFDSYVSNRELYFEYDEITPGKKFYNFDEFINQIGNIDVLNYENERRKVSDLLIKNYSFDACEKTYCFFKNKDKI